MNIFEIFREEQEHPRVQKEMVFYFQGIVNNLLFFLVK
jgi:hypothetical protein